MTNDANILWPRLSIASLLHDIGLFRMRAVAGPTSHIEHFDLCVQELVPLAWRADVQALVQVHHAPQTPNAQRLHLADVLSLGGDDQANSDAPEPKSLQSIFCNLNVGDTSAPPTQYWRLRPLAVDENSVMPTSAKATRQDYSDLWAQFLADAHVLCQAHEPIGNAEVYAESLQLLMQRYITAVPAASDTVSLYDHSRTTAALAVALSGLGDADIAALNKADLSATKKEVALLIGGDLSGIQDFIYTITSKGAASGLRGRSFYLQLLTEAILRFVLRRFGLPHTSVLYAGGGRFYLIAPLTKASEIPRLQHDVDKVMLHFHAGDVYASLIGEPLKASDFFEGGIRKNWESLGKVLQRRKQQRFANLGTQLIQLFEPQGEGGDTKNECQATGMEHPRVEQEDGIRKSDQCKSYESLGNDLRNAQFLQWEQEEDAPLPDELLAATRLGTYADALKAFGLCATLWERLPKNAQGLLLALDGADLRPTQNLAVGQRILANVTPRLSADEIDYLRNAGVEDLADEGRTKPFSAMALQSQGVKRLGILRMDVDNLGKLFSEGLGNTASLARVASLSAAVNLFFEGWVSTCARDINKVDKQSDATRLGERLYSIYSGGDDLFFVGAWDAVMMLANKISQDLTRYAAGHPGIHVSAGVALVGGKYPLYKAAEDAAKAEKAAKRIKDKNAMTFLDVPLTWSQHRAVRTLAEELAAWCDAGIASKALLQTLQQLHQTDAQARAEAAQANKKSEFTRAAWMAAYQLSRMAETVAKRDADAAKRINEICDDVVTRPSRLQHYALAARWAQLKIRGS